MAATTFHPSKFRKMKIYHMVWTKYSNLNILDWITHTMCKYGIQTWILCPGSKIKLSSPLINKMREQIRFKQDNKSVGVPCSADDI